MNAKFSCADPLLLDAQLTDDGRAVRDAAHAYCQEKLAACHKQPALASCHRLAVMRAAHPSTYEPAYLIAPAAADAPVHRAGRYITQPAG